MAVIQFPSLPTISQIHTQNGLSWIWTGTTWDIYSEYPKTPIHKIYNNETDLLNDQENQYESFIYYVIGSNLYYEKLSTSNGLINDYRIFPSITFLNDNYVPYTGATKNVNLGEFGLYSGFLKLDTTPTNTPIEQGTIYWDDAHETAALIMNGTIQHIGQDTFYYVKNNTGGTILKGTAVGFSGTEGNSGHILIAPFIANGTVPSQYFMGVTSENIPNGEFGMVMHFGSLNGINTSAFPEGSILYASTTVAGGFQTTVPLPPNNIIIVAAVLSSANNGILTVRSTLGSNINNDEGVFIQTPLNKDLLVYNNTTTLWENKSLSFVIGGTSSQFVKGDGSLDSTIYVPTSRTLTFTTNNGLTGGTTAVNLSLDRSWTFGLTGQALALHNLATNGIIVRTGTGTVAARTLTAGTGISITNGDGVAGNPTITSTITQYTDALARSAISLTTTGSSGASTYSSSTGVLNIPNYSLAGLGGQPLSTNLTSLAGLSYVSTSFVKMTATGTFTLDTNTYYLASNPNGYTTNTGTVTSVALSLPNIFSVTGSPIISSGTLTATLVSQSAYTVFAVGATTAAPSFITLTSSHIPNLDASKITTGTLSVARGGTGIGSYTAGNYIRALNSTTLEQRTPAQVVSDLGISPSSYQRDKFTYSASNVFTITRNTPNAVMVFLNGQKLQFTDDWSISGSDVTVSTPLLSGDEISIEYFYSTPDVVSSNLNGTGTANYLTKWNGTAELGVSLIQDNGSLVTLPAATDIPAVAATTDTDKFVVLDGNRFKFRTGSEVLNDIGVRTSISLTTTGTSGLATYNSTTGVFNIPNYTYTHPSYTTRSITATGASVLSTFTSDASGHVTGITTRTLTAADIGAAASSHNQAASTITAGTFATGNFVFQGNLDINGQISSPSNAKGNSGTGTVTFNWNDGNMQTVTLNGNCTFAFSNPKSGGVYQIIVTRDATANRTITWPAGIKWGNGVAWEPSGANIIDIITISYDGTTYFAVVTTDMKTI